MNGYREPTELKRIPVMGVDWSGARQPAKSIALACGELRRRKSGDVVHLESCRLARDLGGKMSPDDCRSNVVQAIASEDERWIGCDFPFSLPLEMVGPNSWQTFARHFGKRYPSPSAMRDECRQRLGGEKRRRTDTESKAPWAPTNLRLYRQTFFGIRDLLVPLVFGHQAVVLPMMRDRPGSIKLLEVCPASRLKQVDCYRSYKGRGNELRRERQKLVDRLSDIAGYGVIVRPRDKQAMVEQEGGDLFDAVLAMTIVAGMIDQPHERYRCDRIYRREGFIYY
jgi:hypothetical protein